MAGPRQPIDLIVHKGKKHLTKAEIEERRSREIKAHSDNVRHPEYLPEDLVEEFNYLADQLLDIGIMSNLDCDALAKYLISQKLYLNITKQLLSDPSLMLDKDLVGIQDKMFKQSRSAAMDLGLTISSRCKLVIPKKEEKQQTNKFSKFAR